MKRNYIYEPPFYNIEVVFVGVFCIGVLVACIFSVATDTLVGRGLGLVFGVIAFYQVWNTFISISNPEKVTVDEENDIIAFSGFGRTDEYHISELTSFLVRPFPSSGKTYIRVNKHGFRRGRYWIPTKMFSDSRELFDYLVGLEYYIHPDSIKARARNVNQEYINHAEQIQTMRKMKKRNKKC